MQVQHLVENESNLVKPVVVADETDDTEGTIDAEKAVAEFEVESFSVFTVEWNDGTTDTIEVHVYNMNGTSISETLDDSSERIAEGGTITVSNLVDHLHSYSALGAEYTYQYATVIYETSQGGPGYSSDTLGSSDNSVVSISKSGTTYTVTYGNGSAETVTDPDLIKINLYYSTPTITLETVNPYDDTVNFTTRSVYFQHEDEGSVTYTWALSDDSAGTLTHDGTSGEAVFKWADTAEAGDQVTVTVTKIVTYTDSEGNEQQETASDTYILTYGDVPATITVYAADGTTPQGNAHVALVDANGNTVATGITGDDGTVTLYAPAGEYKVGVTYVYLVSEMGGGSTSRATAETTITVIEDEAATGSVTLGTAITSGPGGATSGSNGSSEEPYYEHIDVKVAAAETEDTKVQFSDLDAVYVYDKYGNLIYVSDDLERNPDTGDYNCLFDINGNEDQHSIVVSSEDTIVIVYEVVYIDENGIAIYSTYTATYSSSTCYPDGEYYPYNSINAWQLYSLLYSDWSSDEFDTDTDDGREEAQAAFEEAWLAGTLDGYNVAGIDISGKSYILIADYLCDTRTTTGQAGLDFVIDVLEIQQDTIDLRVAKTFEEVPSNLLSDDLEDFTFVSQRLKTVTDDETQIEYQTESIWSLDEGNVLSTSYDTVSGWTDNGDGTWSGMAYFKDAYEYEAVDGTYIYYYILSEQTPTTAIPKVQYYGLKVTVTYTSSTGLATVVVSYCTLSKGEDSEEEGEDEDAYFIRTSEWTGITPTVITDADTGEVVDTYYAVPFTNIYNIPEVHKYVSNPTFGESTDDELKADETDNTNTLEYKLVANNIGGVTDLVLHDYLDDQLDISSLKVQSVTLYWNEDTDSADGEEGAEPVEEDENTNSEDEENDAGYLNRELEENVDYSFKIITDDDKCSAECGLDGCSFEILVEDEVVKDLPADSYIIVIFDIDAKEDASSFGDNYVYKIDNEVGLSYEVSGIPSYAEPDETATYSYGFELYKYDAESEDPSESPLAGAKFVLSKDGEEEGTLYAQFDSTDDGYLLTGWTESKDAATSIVTGSDGNAVIVGLHDGTYTIEETEAPKGYTKKENSITVTITADEEDYSNPTITVDEEEAPLDDYTVSIQNEPEKIDINGSKVWVNDEEKEGDRPDSITIYLYADGEPVTDSEGSAVTTTATADDWTWSFTDLPKYKTNDDGEKVEISYTVLEGIISSDDNSYIPSYTYDVNEDGNIDVTITNALPEVHKYVSDPVYGESTDDGLHEDETDNNDTLEYRMEADHIGGAHDLVLHDLLDEQLDIESLVIKSVTLYADEEDAGTVLNEGIDYTVTTGECSANCGLEGCSFEIHVIDEDVENLSSDAYVIVIFDIDVQEGVEDFDDNTYVDEIDNEVGLSFTVSNVAMWAEPDETETYSYGFDLYKYDSETNEPLAGVEFVLSKDVDEGTLYAQFDSTGNTYLLTGWVDSPDDATAIVTGDDGNAIIEGLHDGTFNIEETKAPNGYQQIVGTITVTITVAEDDPLNPTITATNADVDGMEVQIANTPGSPETIELVGSKTWIDSDNSMETRPESITIDLYADGEPALDADGDAITAVITADDNWAWSFTDLPKYQADNVTEIVYTVVEESADELGPYIPSYSENGLDVTNAIPEVHKYVSDPAFGESTDENLKDDEADNNNVLEYKLEAEHVGSATDVVLHDLLDDQLDIDTLAIQSVTLYENAADKEGTVLTEGTDYTVTIGKCSADCGLDGCSFEIHVMDEDLAGLGSDAYIIVIFDIEVHEGVNDFDENLMDAIVNEVGLSYSNNGVSYYAEPDAVETYSYGFNIFKYTGEDTPLAGAAFVISKEEADGTVYAQFTAGKNAYLLDSWTENENDATALISDGSGNITIEGLHEGSFNVKETVAPEGYALLQDPIAVAIAADENYVPTVTVYAEAAEDLTVRIQNVPEDIEGNNPENPGYGNPNEGNEGNDGSGGSGSSSSAGSSGSSSSDSSSGAKTADTNTMLLYAFLLAACILALFGVRTGLLRRERARVENKHTR